VRDVEPATALFPPQDRDWSLLAGVPLTPLAGERLGREAAQHGFGPAARSLSIDWHDDLAAMQVQRWSEALGEGLVNQRQEQIASMNKGVGPAAVANAPELVVVGMDGEVVECEGEWDMVDVTLRRFEAAYMVRARTSSSATPS